MLYESRNLIGICLAAALVIAGISCAYSQDLQKQPGAAIHGSIRKPPSAQLVEILPTDTDVGIDTRSTAVTVDLPQASAWAAANPHVRELIIYDYSGNAVLNNITPSLFAGDSFAGAWRGARLVINANSGLLRLRPDPSLPGWIISGLN
jgi:hypothetical protein